MDHNERVRWALAVLCCTGCSFIGVRAPAHPPDNGKPIDPRTIHCNDSGLLPAIDALGGAGALAVAGGGLIVEGTSDTGSLKNWKYTAAPGLVVAAIIYFYAAGWGTDRVSRCADLKDGANAVVPVRPIEMDSPGKPKPEDIQIDPP